MHIADLNGRIYERRKLERIREYKFAAWSGAFLLTVLVLALCMGGE
jgi:hypothetical protein